MRYWIYWNDLVQGPFEAEELATLRAFTADLPVCEEDSQEWLPAAAVSELLRYIQPVAPVYHGAPAPPPPPPPAEPPLLSPLQGEFFVEPAGQQHLFDLNGTKHFAFRAADSTSPELEAPPAALTSPFHFYTGTLIPSAMPLGIPDIFEPKPIIPPVEETVKDITTLPTIPLQRVWTPPVATPVVEEPIAPEPLPLEATPRVEVKTRLLPWIAGIAVLLGVIGYAFYLRMKPAPAPIPPEPQPILQPAPDIPAVSPAPIEPPPKPPKAKKTKPVKKPAPLIPKPVAKPVEMAKPEPTPAPVAEPITPAPVEATVAEPKSVPIAPKAEPAVDPWRGREQEAINLVLKQKIYAGQRSIGDNARVLIDSLHEKELLYAADTGERLYAPDKASWSALHEEKARYRVYLNFLAWQANGERTLSKSDQFSVDLQKRTVAPLDDTTRHDFYQADAMLVHQHSPKAGDIQNILNGVDVVNKNKLHAMIMKADKEKEAKKSAEAALKAAEEKLRKEIIYFRTKYAEKALQNVAKAYAFLPLLNGK